MASSELRRRLAAGQDCSRDLPASVRQVIRRKGCIPPPNPRSSPAAASTPNPEHNERSLPLWT